MFCRLINFFNKNSIITSHQFGFRSGFSTEMALLELTRKIAEAADGKQFTVAVFLDLSKAFDNIDHEILINKLFLYGIRGTPLKWFESYLFDRQHYVEIRGLKSSLMTVTKGVPQGSVLGPLLFILYINDPPDSSVLVDSILFADDTNVYCCGYNIDEIIKIMEKEIQK